MPIATLGAGTKFDYEPDFSGKVKIITPEGSSVAVSAEDLLVFVAHCYVIPQRDARNQRKEWRDVLVGS